MKRHIAAEETKVDIAKLLLKHDANAYLKNKVKTSFISSKIFNSNSFMYF